jgi:hypothetical protein
MYDGKVVTGVEVKDKQPSDHLIAYMDILGYKDYFKEHFDKNPDKIVKFHNAIDKAFDKAIKESEFNKFGHPQIKLFSDNILISVKCVEKEQIMHTYEILLLIIIVSNIQRIFFSNYGLVLRGAIVKGSFYMHNDGKYVFGKALIDAVELEEKDSIYPRVIIKTEIVDKLLELIRDPLFANMPIIPLLVRKFILRDGDKQYFVNYFPIEPIPYKDERAYTIQNIFSDLPSPSKQGSSTYKETDKKTLTIFRSQLVEKVREYGTYDNLGIKNTSTIEIRRSVMTKYIWMLDYYNMVCRISGNVDFILDFKLSMDITTHQPKVVILPQKASLIHDDPQYPLTLTIENAEESSQKAENPGKDLLPLT